MRRFRSSALLRSRSGPRSAVAAVVGAALLATLGLSTSAAAPTDKPSPSATAGSNGVGYGSNNGQGKDNGKGNGYGAGKSVKPGPGGGLGATPDDGAPSPALAVDTMVPNVPGGRNQPGIKVGTSYYAAPYLDGKGSYNQYGPSQWQVLVLDQRSSGVVWNRTYGVKARSSDTPGAGSITASLADDLAGLRTKPEPVTVIVSAHAAKGFAGFYPHGNAASGAADPTSALKALNFTPSSQAQQTTVGVQGAFSLIASVDTTAASSQFRWSDLAGGGRMTGLLVLNQYRSYAYLPIERVSMDTRSGGGCDAKKVHCTVSVTVGDNTQTADQVGGGGYFVTVWDKLTLGLVSTKNFATNGPDSLGQARLMTTFLTDLAVDHAGDLVIVTSLVTPGVAGRGVMVDPTLPYADMVSLSTAVASVGGTRNAFNSAAAASDDGYTLVGSVDPLTTATREGRGQEVRGKDARVRAALTRDPESLLRAQPLAPGQSATDELTALALSRSTGTWPTLDQTALTTIRTVVHDTSQLDVPADPRRAYWSLDWDSSTWFNMAGAVAKQVKSPPDAISATAKQLSDEMYQVAKVRALLGSLKKPIEGLVRANDNTDRVNTVAGALASDLLNNPEPVPFDWETLVTIIMAICAILAPEALIAAGVTKAVAGLAPKIFQAVSIDVQFGKYVGQTVTAAGGKLPSYADVSIKANALAAKLDETMVSTTKTLDRLGDLVVSDPVKLKTMGSTWCSDVDDPQPAGVCGADNQDAQAVVVAATQRANERLIYTKLAPVVYARYDTGPTYRPQTNGPPDQPASWLGYYECAFSQADLDGAPRAAIALPRQGDYLPYWADRSTVPWSSWPTVQPYVMGVQRTASPYKTPPVYPSTDVLNRMFGTVSFSNVAANGGLGISPERFIPSLPANSAKDCGWSGQGASGPLTYWPSYVPGPYTY